MFTRPAKPSLCSFSADAFLGIFQFSPLSTSFEHRNASLHRQHDTFHPFDGPRDRQTAERRITKLNTQSFDRSIYRTFDASAAYPSPATYQDDRIYQTTHTLIRRALAQTSDAIAPRLQTAWPSTDPPLYGRNQTVAPTCLDLTTIAVRTPPC